MRGQRSEVRPGVNPSLTGSRLGGMIRPGRCGSPLGGGGGYLGAPWGGGGGGEERVVKESKGY